jgi:hypothetical protein
LTYGGHRRAAKDSNDPRVERDRLDGFDELGRGTRWAPPGTSTPAMCSLAAGVEASIRVAREALQDLGCKAPDDT